MHGARQAADADSTHQEISCRELSRFDVLFFGNDNRTSTTCSTWQSNQPHPFFLGNIRIMDVDARVHWSCQQSETCPARFAPRSGSTSHNTLVSYVALELSNPLLQSCIF